MNSTTEHWIPAPLPERPLTRDKVIAWFNQEVESIAVECATAMIPYVWLGADAAFSVGWHADWRGFDRCASQIDLIGELRELVDMHRYFGSGVIDPTTASQIRAAFENLRAFAAGVVDEIDAQPDQPQD